MFDIKAQPIADISWYQVVWSQPRTFSQIGPYLAVYRISQENPTRKYLDVWLAKSRRWRQLYEHGDDYHSLRMRHVLDAVYSVGSRLCATPMNRSAKRAPIEVVFSHIEPNPPGPRDFQYVCYEDSGRQYYLAALQRDYVIKRAEAT